MSAKVDPLEVARRWVDEAEHYLDSPIVPLARVVLAAAERVKHGHSTYCPWANYADGRGHQCDCGHDALVAALEGRDV